jgi:hypothetical protein
MQQELRKRRDETFEMLVVKGYDYRRVVDTLADRYDVATGTIEADISRMSDWLPQLSHYDDDSGAGRLRELHKNRQRMHQMATEARQDEARMEELKIRRQIDSSVSTEVELAQSLGHVEKQPEEHDLDVSGGILAPPEAINEHDDE